MREARPGRRLYPPHWSDTDITRSLRAPQACGCSALLREPAAGARRWNAAPVRASLRGYQTNQAMQHACLRSGAKRRATAAACGAQATTLGGLATHAASTSVIIHKVAAQSVDLVAASSDFIILVVPGPLFIAALHPHCRIKRRCACAPLHGLCTCTAARSGGSHLLDPTHAFALWPARASQTGQTRDGNRTVALCQPPSALDV